MHRILAAVAVIAILSSVGTAQAGPAETIPAAQSWWEQLLEGNALPAPTKKKPLHYGVFPYAAEPCGAFEVKRVDKVTTRKALGALTSCLGAAIGLEETPESTWEPSDVDTLLIGFDDAKQAKKIRKATKKMEIVSLEVRGSEDAAAVHVFFAVDKQGAVRGVFMYVDAGG
jgi:hypothetical protein